QVGPAAQPALVVQRQVGFGEHGVGLHTGGPHHGIGVELRAVRQDDVPVLDRLQQRLELHLDAAFTPLPDGVLAPVLADLRQDPPGGLDEHPAHGNVVEAALVVGPADAAGHVLQLGYRLHARVAAADEEEAQRPAAYLVVIGGGSGHVEPIEDAVAQPDRLF